MIYSLFILDDQGVPEEIDDGLAWATWMTATDTTLHVTQVPGAELEVSTVFLGVALDAHPEDGRPLLWETQVTCPHGKTHTRHADRSTALQYHADAVIHAARGETPCLSHSSTRNWASSSSGCEPVPV